MPLTLRSCRAVGGDILNSDPGGLRALAGATEIHVAVIPV
jgi:hypothetical protein